MTSTYGRGATPTATFAARAARRASEPDWSSMTVAELREQATARELDTSGTKAELIERLRGA